jgi:hypothetical protein
VRGDHENCGGEDDKRCAALKPKRQQHRINCHHTCIYNYSRKTCKIFFFVALSPAVKAFYRA